MPPAALAALKAVLTCDPRERVTIEQLLDLPWVYEGLASQGLINGATETPETPELENGSSSTLVSGTTMAFSKGDGGSPVTGEHDPDQDQDQGVRKKRDAFELESDESDDLDLPPPSKVKLDATQPNH